MANKILIITGESLSPQDIRLFVTNPSAKVKFDNKTKEKVKQSHDFVKKHLTKELIYGINTGFGPMASHVLGESQLEELQANLIKSHAVGMGKLLSDNYVLAAMLVRLNTLAKGYSGVSVELLEQLAKFINLRILPVIPEHGAVGTSGDLVQLAHIALGLIGFGQVSFKGKLYNTAELLRQLKLNPYRLKPKEGLSLINGTSMMSAVGSLITEQAAKLIDLETRLGAMSLEIVGAYSDSLSPALHAARPHRGQQFIAAKLRKLLSSSRLLRNRSHATKDIKINGDIQRLPEAIQEVYSLRCLAQILGPIEESRAKTAQIITTEINSATDNPLVDIKGKQFLHGGNFHGDYVASAIDQLKTAIVKMTILSERRINYFLNHKINNRFPPFLNLKRPGLNLGLQGLQFVATSTTAKSQSLAYPHHIHSIPTNGDNQDVVSMGTDAVLLAAEVVDNAAVVLAIELIALCQAVDYLGITSKLSLPAKELYQLGRKYINVIKEDRPFGQEAQNLFQALLENNAFSD